MEKISVIEFLKKYRNNEISIDDIFIRDYCPIMEKRVILDSFLNKSEATLDDGFIYIDTITYKVNSVIAFLTLYTKLDLLPENNENATAYDIYDFLQEAELIDLFYKKIPTNEQFEFSTIQYEIKEMFEKRELSTMAFINKVINEFGKGFIEEFGKKINGLSEALSDEKGIERFISMAKNNF